MYGFTFYCKLSGKIAWADFMNSENISRLSLPKVVLLRLSYRGKWRVCVVNTHRKTVNHLLVYQKAVEEEKHNICITS